MKAAVFYFSDRGRELAAKVREALEALDADVLCLSPGKELYQKTAELFPICDALVFIGASGIAVRAIAPNIKAKTVDPAVIVIDDTGKNVISLLSGHIGGANKLTLYLAEKLGSNPVITTATDVNGKFSVDNWAKENGFAIDDMRLAKDFSAAILKGRLPVYSELPVAKLHKSLYRVGKAQDGRVSRTGTEAGVDACSSGFASAEGSDHCGGLVKNQCGNTCGNGAESGFETEKPTVGLSISVSKCKPFEKTLIIVPKLIHLGIGCRRGTPYSAIEEAVFSFFDEHDLDLRAIKDISSIDLKKDEEGLLEFCRAYDIPARFFSAEELNEAPGEYKASSFVRTTTGTDNVCERAAVLSSGSEYKVLVHKTAAKGITLAAALEIRRLEIE